MKTATKPPKPFAMITGDMVRPAAASLQGGVAKTTRDRGIPLNFRVDATFRRRFRQYALDHDMRLSEVLVLAFDHLVNSHRS